MQRTRVKKGIATLPVRLVGKTIAEFSAFVTATIDQFECDHDNDLPQLSDDIQTTRGVTVAKDCLFCKIATKEIPGNVEYEDNEIVAFHDVSPQAPTHVLIIPRKHIDTINETSTDDRVLLGTLVLTARKIAADLGLAEDGYRLVFNVNRNAGQSVFHIHLHLLGGRMFSWPPG